MKQVRWWLAGCVIALWSGNVAAEEKPEPVRGAKCCCEKEAVKAKCCDVACPAAAGKPTCGEVEEVRLVKTAGAVGQTLTFGIRCDELDDCLHALKRLIPQPRVCITYRAVASPGCPVNATCLPPLAAPPMAGKVAALRCNPVAVAPPPAGAAVHLVVAVPSLGPVPPAIGMSPVLPCPVPAACPLPPQVVYGPRPEPIPPPAPVVHCEPLCMPPAAVASGLYVVADGDGARIEMGNCGSEMRMRCKEFSLETCDGTMTIRCDGKHVEVATESLKASATSMKVDSHGTLTFEGEVRLCYSKEGQHADIKADRISVNLKDGGFTISGVPMTVAR